MQSRGQESLAYNKKKANWVGHMLRRNRFIVYVIEGKIKGTRIRGRRRKQLAHLILLVDPRAAHGKITISSLHNSLKYSVLFTVCAN